jgi:type IV pilus assembly protein PilB
VNKHRKRLGDMLVESALLTKEQLQQALAEKPHSEKLGDYLVGQNLVTEQQLIEALEKQLGIPQVSLYQYPIDEHVLKLVSKELAKKYRLIPLKKEGNKLFIAMSDPMDFFALDDLRLSTGFQIERAIASKDEINRTISKYYEFDDSMEEMLQEIPTLSVGEREEASSHSPIVKLVNQIFTSALTQRASDIHIDPRETKLLIRYRIDGVLKTEQILPKTMQSMITARIKIMANLNITESRLPQDGRIKVNLEFHPIDLRVSTLPTVHGEKIVMRILDLSNTLSKLDKMGFNQINLKRFMHMIEQPTGMVLITGPTGSGKSSTLYAALNHLSSEFTNVITVEDPVEYQLEGINQIQVNEKVGLTFAAGLRAILRQDPDIVMVGEIRDTETADVAVRASLTGHLVLSTLHTNDSIATVIRLIDMGVEPFLVASSLAGVVAQRLVRRVCRDCADIYEPTLREKELFKSRGMKVEKITRGNGCPTCNMTGYKGRIALHEVLVIDESFRKMIMNDQPLSDLREYAVKNGTIFLVDDGLVKIKQGLTTTEEVLRVAVSG